MRHGQSEQQASLEKRQYHLLMDNNEPYWRFLMILLSVQKRLRSFQWRKEKAYRKNQQPFLRNLKLPNEKQLDEA